ncbi:hypothetical protein M422DRAFT_155836 [Sphaerobolus stellatus SS14]|nr:hypothetical protein M422DRAFT_155836 [Sphaerobolus stellatus SS14]
MVALPDIDGIPASKVICNFKVKKVHCVQTFQWTGSVPIAWGKCYTGENLSQVYELMYDIWKDHPEDRPGFLFYDDACNLVHHMLTSHPEPPWLHSTRFIVDAFHYMTHRATDAVCCLWCNPLPADGSKPDLLISQVNEAGEIILQCAYSSEAAEQLNSWLTSFERQFDQMSDITFDFFMHSLLLLHKEEREKDIK